MYWGHMSVLDADLICLRELRARNKHWQHAATLAGTGEKKNISWFFFVVFQREHFDQFTPNDETMQVVKTPKKITRLL